MIDSCPQIVLLFLFFEYLIQVFIVFSAILNPYISDDYDFIFLDLDNFSENSVKCYYNNDDYEYNYESCNKLFIIHKFENNIYLQMEERNEDKKWSIVKKDGDSLFLY